MNMSAQHVPGMLNKIHIRTEVWLRKLFWYFVGGRCPAETTAEQDAAPKMGQVQVEPRTIRSEMALPRTWEHAATARPGLTQSWHDGVLCKHYYFHLFCGVRLLAWECSKRKHFWCGSFVFRKQITDWLILKPNQREPKSTHRIFLRFTKMVY